MIYFCFLSFYMEILLTSQFGTPLFWSPGAICPLCLPLTTSLACASVDVHVRPVSFVTVLRPFNLKHKTDKFLSVFFLFQKYSKFV